MAKTKISEFSATAANNTDIDGINIAENCPPSGINDAIRELMAQLKDWQAGTSNDPYVIGSSGSLTLNQGTANGVLYLNGSKVATSGSTLQFDGSGKLALGNVAHTSFIPTTSLTLGNSGANAEIRMGQADTSALISKWVYNATVGNAYGAIETYGQSNYIQFGASDFRWQVASSEQMRLTSTGLGIGTSSPSYKLQVSGGATSLAANQYLRFGTGIFAAGDGSATNYLFSGSTGMTWRNAADSADLMVLNNSGNLGLGVTPSAWGSGIKSLDVNGSSFASSTGTLDVTQNAYYNGSGWIYKNTATSSKYTQSGGVHYWFNAGSGTAGNAITFTQAMTLDSGGNRQLGGTTSRSVSGYRFDSILGTSGAYTDYYVGTTLTGNIGVEAGSFNVTASNSVPLVFNTGSAERARIDSSGNLLVGTTSQINGERLSVVAGASNGVYFKNTSQANYTQLVWNSATSGDNSFIAFGTEGTYTGRGSITYNRAGGLVAYNVTSDYRAKDIIGPVVNSGTLIDSVPVYMGKMKGATQERPMFIAHETPSYAHTGVKDAVDEHGNPVYQQMDASALIPVMWAEIQSLRKRLADAGIA